MNKDFLLESVGILYDKYCHENELLEKLNKYVLQQLPELMEKNKRKVERKKQLENQSNEFINNFIYTGKAEYFYLKPVDVFIIYDGEHFRIINGSELVHEILQSVNLNKVLKTKNKECDIKKN